MTTPKKYKSFAMWPVGTVGDGRDITDDIHNTKEQAEGVCDLLRQNGFGGDLNVFPLRAWTEPAS